MDYILLEQYTKNIRVLFVEDDELVRKETTELLLDIFSHVDVACDGQEGLEKYNHYFEINRSYYDLVITDIKMPNMDGITLTKEIYKQNKKQELIILSAHSDSDYLMKLVNIGISQFIVKPIELDNFLHIIFNISKMIYFAQNASLLPEEEDIYLNKSLIWNKKSEKLIQDGMVVRLTKKEFLFVKLLLQITEKTHTVEEILAYVWKGDEENPDIKNLKNVISRLRKKVPSLDIENVYGFGYKINIK